MGTDIDAYVEIRDPDGVWRYGGDNLFPDNEYPTERHCPFDGARSYGLFGFLADVRNYSEVPVISPPRGLPDDVSAELRDKEDGDGLSTSWLTLAELLAFDYDQTFWDRRVTKDGNGRARAEEGEGEHLTVREFLGDWYFRRLDLLAKLGAPEDVRIVFWFD